MMEVNYSKLLDDKAGLLKEMLELTKVFTESGASDMDKAEAYSVLLDKREVLFEQIKAIDGELKISERLISESGVGGRDRDHGLEQSIKETIRLFLSYDEKALEIAKGISNGLSKNIKVINNGRTVNQLYQNTGMLNTTRFDKQN